MAKTAPPQNDPFALFVNARSFLFAAGAIDDMNDRKSLAVWPSLVNQAFSLELHTKCLLLVRGQAGAKIHDLEKLFQRVGAADRLEIEKNLSHLVQINPYYIDAKAKGIPLDVDSILMRTKDMFEKGRYWHEGVLPGCDNLGFVGDAGCRPLADAICLLLVKVNPTWTDDFKGYRMTMAGGQLPS